MGKILVVDDEDGVLELLRDFLAKEKGHEVFTASGGDEALAVVEDQEPDIVLLDIMMPGKSGMEVLVEIKRLRPSTKVIMITAGEDEVAALQAVERGASDYLKKPLDLEYLDAQVTFELKR